ncbi:MAG: ATP-binding domain-containing protein, partial [Bacteroidales bacterium]|nr:ATP-binding domain-containing protein [Bacteroidales bacterium]
QPEPSLSNEQETELFIDFSIRMKAKGIKEDTEAFFTQQMTDPWINAVRAKFGYVITCHRAQGGEWDDVFIDVEASLLFIKSEFYLRWAYTAVSRSAKRLHFLKKSFIKDY